MSEPVVVQRRVAASPAAVYSHLTDSEKWATWQGASAQIEARPGGIFRMTMGTGQVARGQFLELVENRRVVFTWGWIDLPDLPPGSTVVEIDLEPDGDGTVIRLTHSQLPPDQRDIHRTGWDHYVVRLATASTGTDPGPDPGPGA